MLNTLPFTGLLAANPEAARLDENPFVALIAGGAIALFALFLIAMHMISWHRQREDPLLSEKDREWLGDRFRRRMQTSGMLLIIGVLIPVGDQLVPLNPNLFAIYWLIVLGATVWVVLQALGDAAATNSHAKTELARVRLEQQKLALELERLRKTDDN